LPGLLQSLFGYDAYRAGLPMPPAGIFSIMALSAQRCFDWPLTGNFEILKGVRAK
jgi:hypothetical protein